MDGFKKFQQYWVQELIFHNRMEAFFENFHQKWKMRYVSIHVVPNQVSKRPFYTFEGIDLREFHAKFIKIRVKLWELIQSKG